MEKTRKGDFIELEFTGYHDGKVFDSNIPEELKKLNPDAKAEKMIVVIGQKMVPLGLDGALEDKEINKEYEIHIPYKDGFGERKRELVKTIPLSVFTKQKINPHPGATLFMDNALVRIITVSGARVITDFNNPLAGKDLDYKFKIKRIVKEYKEKVESFFNYFFKTVPKFDILEKKVLVNGEEQVKLFVEAFKEKFKEILKRDLDFKLIEKKKQGTKKKEAPQ